MCQTAGLSILHCCLVDKAGTNVRPSFVHSSVTGLFIDLEQNTYTLNVTAPPFLKGNDDGPLL